MAYNLLYRSARKVRAVVAGVLLLLYAPVINDTAQFLAAECSFRVSNITEHNTYSVHQIFIPFGPTPHDWEWCSSTWNTFDVKRWDKDMCTEVITQAMPSRRELLDYQGVMFTDVCRVAIMYVHGGVYADMDICAKQDTVFPKCDACLIKTSVGVSNDLIIAQKNHPIFANILYHYAESAWMNNWWYLPYIQEMYSTGPVRFTLATSNFPNTRVITYEQINIQHIHGNSWHKWDAMFFMHPWVFLCASVLILVYTYICAQRKRNVILGKNI